MKKPAMLMGCIFGLMMVLQAGSAGAQGTADKGTATGKGTATSKGALTTKGAATGKNSKAPATKTSSSSPTVLKDEKDKVSYALGMNVGTNLRSNLQKNSIEFDSVIVLQAIKDALAGAKPLMTEDEARAVLTQLQQQVMAKQQEKVKQVLEANKKEGEAFLAANKAKEGVVTLPSGLQYKILTQGTGPKPAGSDTVVCNYRGTLINGTEFDSSYKRGEPTSFKVVGVIRGWTEALQLMPVGSKWQLFIPSDLAYGERGNGNIEPNSTLIFEVELISIQAK